MHLQDTVEAPEGEQQRVSAAHAEGDVHDSSCCQSTCNASPFSSDSLTCSCGQDLGQWSIRLRQAAEGSLL